MPLPLSCCLIALDRAGVDPRRRDVRAEPVEGEDRRREQDLLADLADPECSEDRGDHRLMPPAPRSAAISWQVPPAPSICSRADLLNPCACTVSGLVSSPSGEHLDRDVLAGREALGLHRLERDGVAGLEPGLEVDQVDRLGVGPERLERHRLLHVRAAQLAHPHVDRVLAALEPGPALGARAGAPALLAAAGCLAGARTLAPADALARLARPGGRLQVVQPDPLFSPQPSSETSTRCRTLWIIPRTEASPAAARSARSAAAQSSAACRAGACRRHCATYAE